MSHIPYIPGKTAPETFGRYRRRLLASKLGSAVEKGRPSSDNPLGLFFPCDALADENGEWGLPEAYWSPYVKLGSVSMKRCNLFPGDEPVDPITAIGGLVFGGMYAHVLTDPSFDDLERIEFPDYENARFGTYVCAALQREIAKLLVREVPGISDAEIFELLLRSYNLTAGKLTRCRNDDSVAIETYIGVRSPEELDEELIEAILTLHEQQSVPSSSLKKAVLCAELSIVDEEHVVSDLPLCGGEYVRHGNLSLTQLLWKRIIDVATELPWSLDSIKNQAGA